MLITKGLPRAHEHTACRALGLHSEGATCNRCSSLSCESRFQFRHENGQPLIFKMPTACAAFMFGSAGRLVESFEYVSIAPVGTVVTAVECCRKYFRTAAVAEGRSCIHTQGHRGPDTEGIHIGERRSPGIENILRGTHAIVFTSTKPHTSRRVMYSCQILYF